MHDPNQLFTVSTVSRSDIADFMGVDVSDPRLTASFCQTFANAMLKYDEASKDDDHFYEEVVESLQERFNRFNS